MKTRELVLEKLMNPRNPEMDLQKAIDNHLEAVYSNDKSYLKKMTDSLWYGGRGTFTTSRGIRKKLRNTPGNILQGAVGAGAGLAIAASLPVTIPVIAGGTAIAIAADGAKTKGFTYIGKAMLSVANYISSVVVDQSRNFVHKKWSDREAESSIISQDTIRKKVKHAVKDLTDPITIIERNMVKMRDQIDRTNKSIVMANEHTGNTEDFHEDALMALEGATASMYYRDKIACIVDGMKTSLENIRQDLDKIGVSIAESRNTVRYEIVRRRSARPRTNLWGDF